MTISDKINQYIENSKIKGKLARWKKGVNTGVGVNVYITPIVADLQNKEFYYSEIKKAMAEWNRVMISEKIPVQFVLTETPKNADIIIHWTKVGRVFEGMCKYLSVIDGELKKISIDIGLYNACSPKNTTDESIFFSMMHEFGHALGLGHGVEIDDVMYVPHQKNISTPSENDIYVLKKIYSV
ncbi:MAG: matrixin family metalloprotease [Cyanobacteria bacterium RUI128]|nr:matrixin family metalloprotease [Cyanobacteria bacterium RUI128]